MIECSLCNNLNCRKCIDSWTQNNQTCPKCHACYSPSAKPNLFVTNKISETEFQCLACPTKFLYHSLHQFECNNLTHACPLCNSPGMTLENLEIHWAYECPHANLMCEVCHFVSKRHGIYGHNCEQHLMLLDVDHEANSQIFAQSHIQ